jgi:hypothetical protein
MTCPSCGRRKGRRDCPALGQTICSVCCGSKRLTEIACPTSCRYLAAARQHPPGIVLRQQRQDAERLLPILQSLDEPQRGVFLLLNGMILRHEPTGFARLTDDDVVDAATSLASTLETEARGLIYEHAPQSPTARRLAKEIRAMLDRVRGEGVSLGDAAEVLRAIARGAEQMRTVSEGDAAAYLMLMKRVLATETDETAAEPHSSGPAIILP